MLFRSSFAYTSAGSFARICRAPKVLMPKYDDVGEGSSADAARGEATKRELTARRAAARGNEASDMWLPYGSDKNLSVYENLQILQINDDILQFSTG